MVISGLQKLTLLDYPGKVACTIFTAGCNFRCPFCHNSDLVLPQRRPPVLPEEEVLAFLRKRRGLLDGVCVTGGEPLLHRDLAPFLVQVKELGYAVKLDTNGSDPDALAALVRGGLADYVAMDIKNSPRRYAETAGIPGLDLRPIRRSVEFLLTGAVDYEFRTTVTAQYHDESSFRDLGPWLKGARRYVLQEFVDSGDVLCSSLSPCTPGQMERFRVLMRPYVGQALLRSEMAG